MIQLRDYQEEAAIKGIEILNRFKILILNYEVRTGKTHIALHIAKRYKNVLFVTKKKAISSIDNDYKNAEHSFKITIINYESLHKISGCFDLVIVDESHSIGAYPKPSKRTKQLKTLVKNDLILLTGTLMPESNSQIYHQLWISNYSPFNVYTNFYKFFNDYGIPEVIYTTYGQSKSYKNLPYERISSKIEPIKLSKTQSEIGFKSSISENFLYVDLLPKTLQIIKQLKKDLVVQGKKEVILADTPVKLMQKVHQLSGGTIKFESGNSAVLDYSKAEFISRHFQGKKIAIFYKFKEELNAIKQHLDITQDIDEFDNTSKNIALQIVSGREGTNLSSADYLVYYNIDFSAVSYWQSRDRLTTKDRSENNVFWIFSRNGIEQRIYKAVMNKKNYTLQTFKKDEQIPK